MMQKPTETAAKRVLDEPSIEEGVDSEVLDASKLTVLLVAQPGADTEAIAQGIAKRQLARVVVKDVSEVQMSGMLPRFAVVEASLPGGLDLIRKLAPPPREVSVVALVSSDEDAAALEAGASATLRRPVVSESIAKVLEHLQRHQALLAESRELFERDTANALVSTTSRIAAAIAHEIRNPLAGARLSIDWLLKSVSAAQTDRDDALRDIEHALSRIDGTVSAIASLASGEAPPVEPIALYDVAEEAVRNVSNSRLVPIEVRGDRTIMGLGSRKLLTQAVVNLVHNALDALKTSTGARVLVRVYGTDSESRISVRDNGPGVPPNLRERIFEPFFSTKGKRGTGLGLAIARRAVTNMGGALTLSTQGTAGACFRIRLRKP
jgi:signal transduction histidine kinase